MIFGLLLMKISFLHHSQMLTLSYYSHISHVITYPDLRQWIWRKKTRLDQNIFKDSLIKNSGETWASFASSKGQFISLFHINKHHKWQLTIARIYKILLFHISFTPLRLLLHQMHNNIQTELIPGTFERLEDTLPWLQMPNLTHYLRKIK